MRNLTAGALFILLGLVLCVPAVAHADTNPVQGKAQTDANKSWKQYAKQQKKAQKKARKTQEKTQKDWKKQHPTGH